MTYSEKLRDPRWQKKRLQILKRDKFKCVYCQDKKTELQIHHLKYSGDPWEIENEFLITVCKECHSTIENIKVPLIKKVVKIKYQLGDGRNVMCLLVKRESLDTGKIIIDVITAVENKKPEFMFSIDTKGELLKALIKISK